MPRRGEGAAGVTAADFAAALTPLLAGERPDHLAVAVSGGADSLALALLAQHWAQKRGASLTAFIVDHRLRADSTKEAKQVARWLKAAGIAARVLAWQHDGKPAGSLQAAARAARYALLAQACARAGIGHLLLAHHRDDQAETLLLRCLRGSGVDGLAAMQPSRVMDDGLALLRPLLDIPKARLVATLQKRRQPWIEDPSNADPAHARVRVRRALDDLAGGDPAARSELVAHLAQTARNLARAKAALAAAAYDVLRAAVTVTPAGIAWLDPRPIAAAPDEVGLRALARLLGAIGGQPLPPRLDRLERLLGQLRSPQAFTAQTLHRCRLLPQKERRARDRRTGEATAAPPPLLLVVCREARHLPAPQPLVPGATILWDGRFRIVLTRRAPAGLQVAALGNARLPVRPLPAAAPAATRAGLPAILGGDGGLLAVPGLGWGDLPQGVTVTFAPPPLA
ncbi:tRNA lysidine(34) synthetase TilS [Ferrovibrio xuzhouensis]|uniref:tRNA(Ile)-lysidine synthase n=1 Tax=Ferrovibrio xuzhouensis TaxID=1576914 RepID=A0ABV7VAR0_9PROT